MSGETEDMPGVQDFLIFLENVVRADIEIEDNEDEFDSQGALKKATSPAILDLEIELN